MRVTYISLLDPLFEHLRSWVFEVGQLAMTTRDPARDRNIVIAAPLELEGN
jgi:hypothetical protein